MTILNLGCRLYGHYIYLKYMRCPIGLCSQGTALFRARSLWSTFSGMNAGVRGLHQLAMSFLRYGMKVLITVSSTCDRDPHILRSLQSDYGQGCVYADILSFFPETKACGHFPYAPYYHKARIMKNATPYASLHCLRHGCQCEVQLGEIAIGGFPCVDFSRAGNTQGTDGTTSLVALVRMGWAGKAVFVFDATLLSSSSLFFLVWRRS